MRIAQLVDAFEAKTWEKLGRWKKAFMLNWIETTSLGRDRFSAAGMDWSISNYGFLDHDAMMATEDFEATKDYYLRQIREDPAFFRRYATRCYEQGTRLLEFSSAVTSRVSATLGAEELADDFHKFCELVASNIPFFPAFVPLEEVLDNTLRSLLATHLRGRNTSLLHLFDYLALLSRPSQPPVMIQRRDALLRLRLAVAGDARTERLLTATDREAAAVTDTWRIDSPVIWAMLSEFIEQFGWLSTFGWLGEQTGVVDVIEELRDVPAAGCAAELQRIEGERERAGLEITETLRDLKASDELRSVVETVRSFANLRLFRLDVYSESYFRARNLFVEAARRLGVTDDAFLNLTPEEVSKGLKEGLKIDETRINDRADHYALLRLGGEVVLLTGEEYERFDLSRARQDVEALDEVKGEAVVKGVVQGPARVVLDSSQLSKVQRGDILVSPMTNPDFTPVFGRIAGIVTDQGGLLCHAAIVAREYGLPCLIDTKHATQVFRDGEIICLDGETGTATRLHHSDTREPTEGKHIPPAAIGHLVLSAQGENTTGDAIVWFGDAVAAEASEVGGKFRNLTLLHRQGLPVPAAFCIRASAFSQFLETNGLLPNLNAILASLDTESPRLVDEAAATIADRIAHGRLADELQKQVGHALGELRADSTAVRSSAVAEDLAGASFAGMFDSFLNLRGLAEVLVALKGCWSSLLSPRALHYWTEQMRRSRVDNTQMAMAVVVQELIVAEKSGVCFSLNPTTQSTDELVVQATYGLGQGLVSGVTSGDTYVLQKATSQILSYRLTASTTALSPDPGGGVRAVELSLPMDRSQVLSVAELNELASLMVRIEELFDTPQDVEWAKDTSGHLFVVQARPITALRPG